MVSTTPNSDSTVSQTAEKERVPFEAPSDLKAAFDSAVPEGQSRSDVLRRMMEQYVRSATTDIDARISEIQEEIEEEKKAIQERQNRLADLESELETLKEERERQEAQSEWESRITPIVKTLEQGLTPDEIDVYNARIADDAPDWVESDEDVIEAAEDRLTGDDDD